MTNWKWCIALGVCVYLVASTKAVFGSPLAEAGWLLFSIGITYVMIRVIDRLGRQP